jgi:hypothetical protein
MPRTAEPAVKHLTEAEFAARVGIGVATVRIWRKNGTGPAYLKLSDSATSGTIRYRMADIEAWENARLREHATA